MLKTNDVAVGMVRMYREGREKAMMRTMGGLDRPTETTHRSSRGNDRRPRVDTRNHQSLGDVDQDVPGVRTTHPAARPSLGSS